MKQKGEDHLQKLYSAINEGENISDAELVEQYQGALKAAINEADRAKREKNEFLSRMSHDIRTPLNGIIGMLEIAEKNKDDPDRVQECFEKIRQAASQLLLLVNDVLDINKLEDGNSELACEPFNLNELITECMDELASLVRSNNIHIILTSNHKIRHPCLIGCPQYIRQIFVNVVTNAVKYNKPNGSVEISVDELSVEGDKGIFRLTVEDTGIGMSEKFCERVFEPFSQEHMDSRTTYKGSGLGLTIAKKMVDLLGGMIAVESQQGIGSKFTITLPIEINRSSQFEEEEVVESDLTKLSDLHILMAEDNDLNAEIAEVMLEEAGMSVTRAENGQVAIDRFKSSAPGEFDLILMDIMMPVKSGLEAAKEIRALDRSDALSIPIIALTANVMEKDIQACLAAGMDSHLSKPFESRGLYRTIAFYADNPSRKQKIKKKKNSLDMELHSGLGYGLAEWEKRAGLQKYNHPLFMSQSFFTDGCWEINTKKATAVILQGTIYPEIAGRLIGYERILEQFTKENVSGQDQKNWCDHMSLSVLRELKEEIYFEVVMKGPRMPFSKYGIVLVPSFDKAGKTECVYMSYRMVSADKTYAADER